MPGEARWTLQGFVEQLDLCIERESLDDDLRLIALQWIMTRMTEPYRGVRREPVEHPDFGVLWHGAIPDSHVGGGYVLACSFWASERSRHLRCNSFAVLPLPL